MQDEWRLRSDLTLNVGLRYDLMKTDAPPVRNPDAQLAAADIDTSRLDADTNNWGPRLGVAWSPPSGTLRRARRLGTLLRADAVDHARHGPLEQRHQHRVADVHRRRGADLSRQRSARFRPRGTAARPSIFYIDKDFANSRLMQANTAVEWEFQRDTSLTVTYLFVDGANLPRSIDRNLGTASTRTFTRGRLERRRSRTTSSAPIGRSPTSRA